MAKLGWTVGKDRRAGKDKVKKEATRVRVVEESRKDVKNQAELASGHTGSVRQVTQRKGTAITMARPLPRRGIELQWSVRPIASNIGSW